MWLAKANVLEHTARLDSTARVGEAHQERLHKLLEHYELHFHSVAACQKNKVPMQSSLKGKNHSSRESELSRD